MDGNIEMLETLLMEWEAGTLGADGLQQIREILKADESARAFYVQYQMLGAALKLDDAAGLEPREAVEPVVAASPPNPLSQTRRSGAPVQRPAGRQPRALRSWLVIAAVAFFCMLTGRWLYLELRRETTPADRTLGTVATGSDVPAVQEVTSQGVALITRLVDLSWAEGQAELQVGDAVRPGRLAIASGFAQIEFFCGATVIVEGPAELELQSATRAHVHQGRLRAQVPPAARGFSLTVNDLQVVDLGTEFGMDVSPRGADVQVFDGEVELRHANRQHQRLTTGQGVQRGVEGTFEQSTVTPEAFLDIATLAARSRGQGTARFARWKSWSDEHQADPRLIAYYPFDEPGGWERKLKNRTRPGNDDLDGAIVGAGRVAGRWASKGALEFKRPGDRVRVQIPGEFSSLTFACWVKIDSLDRWYNSLFLTDNYNQGEPHWQILDSGQLFFSVRNRPDDLGQGPDLSRPDHREVLSPPFWKPSMSGQWLHLATTYDVQAQRTTHYLNGQPLHAETIPDNQLMRTTRIGAASIGNWSLPTKPDAHFAVRNLNGSIDEFMIFAAALTAEEIKEMYEHGRP